MNILIYQIFFVKTNKANLNKNYRKLTINDESEKPLLSKL